MHPLLGLVALATLILPANAQDGPLGFAFAQAPEAGTGACFDTDSRKAIECAQAQCIAESGLTAADCTIQAVCLPARWSADIFAMSNEGPHWHEIQCGWQNREKLEAAIKLVCDADDLMECSAVQIWDPEGNELIGTDG